MNRENENLSESRPEISTAEAALAQLRPRREARFADEVKNRIKDQLSDKAPSYEEVTTTVKIPLTHYIRIAQFNAAAGGLLVGILLGILLGGTGVYIALNRFYVEQRPPMPSADAVRSAYMRVLLEDDASYASLERALLDNSEKENRHGRK